MQNYDLEIYRGEEMIRCFKSSSIPFSDQELNQGIRNTFDQSEMFMTTLCVHRAYADYSIGIWNKTFYKVQEELYTAKEIGSFEELKDLFCYEFHLSEYPLQEALDQLCNNGAKPLFP